MGMRAATRLLCLVVAVAACGDPPAVSADAEPTAPDATASAPDAATGDCTELGQEACVARDDCHGTFDIYDCDNILGYCAVFDTCQPGRADCIGPATCAADPPQCAGPYVVSYDLPCYGPCVRADQCAGCLDDKMTFTQSDGCANDGSVEFCITPLLESAIQLIAPTVTCAPGGGRAGCDPATQLLCQFPTQGSDCVSPHGALTDDAWDALCAITMLPGVTEIVPTFAE